MCVPKDLQRYVGKKELRYSLRTGYLGIAKQKARLLAGNIQYLFRYLRDIRHIMSKLTDNQIQTMVNTYIREKLISVEDNRAKYEFTPAPELIEKEEFLEDSLSDVLMDLQQSQYGTASYKVHNLLKKENIHLEHDDIEFKKMCRELLKAEVKYYKVELDRLAGEYSDDIDALFPIPSESSKPKSPVSQIKELSITLDNLIKDYFAENIRAGNWSERTQIEYRSIFNNIKRLFGNVPVNKIERQTVQHLKQVLLVLPKNYFKSTKKYAGVPVSEFINIEPKEKLSAKTVNKYLDNIKALFRFAVDNGYMETNFAEGLRIRIKGKAYEERDIFSNKDLTALFHSKEYTDDTFDQPWKFWLPLLGLYTGCRLEELCQLNVKDIKQISDIWVLDIKEEEQSDKKTKTESSNRFMPLHPTIIEDLNFLGYVKQLEKRNETRLFPELKNKSGRYGHYPSRWFGTYKKNCGIVAPPNKKVFHSFRHNVQDNLKQQLISESLVDELVGHVIQGESRGRYGKPFRVPLLYKKAILKLNYDIDLSHLKNSKYVIKD
jgi:integrase